VELVYDAGALIGAERNSVDLLALHDAALRAGVLPMVPAAVLGQVWRGNAFNKTLKPPPSRTRLSSTVLLNQ
jgi:hypothetical protein